MNENNLPDSRIIFASGLTNIGCDQSGSTFQTLVVNPATSQPQQDTPSAIAKFSYIKSDDPDVIKEIEATMAIYVRGNNPSELCIYLFENEGTLFLKMPKHADTIFSCITDRWGDQNHITKKGLRTAWDRHRPVQL